MQGIVIDSDIIIDHFRIGSSIFNQLLEVATETQAKVYLPGVVFTEINSGQDSKDALKLREIEELLEIFEFTIADRAISQKAGFLLRDNRNLDLADALIAATALSLNAKLATRNKKDFEGIKGLKFFKLTKMPRPWGKYFKY